MDQWKWAFRNLWRQKRRTMINVSTICLGMVFLFLGLGWMGGYDAFIFRGVQDFDTGQVQAVRADYLDQERRLPLDLLLEHGRPLAAQIGQWDGVAEASGRLEFLVKLSFRGQNAHLAARAVDFGAEAGVTVLQRQIRTGEYPRSSGLLIGQGLAAKWGLKPGDTVYLTALDRDGAENFLSLRVSGIFSFGYSPLDDHLLFLDLDTAAGLLDTGDRVSRVVVHLKPGIDPDRWIAAHQSELRGSGTLFSWRRFARETIDAVQADEGSIVLLLGVAFVLATLGMMNSLSMSVWERRRELATLRALGMRQNGVRALLLREGIALGLISSGLAAVLALPAALWLGVAGLDLRPYLPPDLPFPFGDRFRAVFSPASYVLTLLAGGGAAFLGTWLPARRGARAPIIQGIAGRT